MNDGTELDKDKTTKALKQKGLGLNSFSKEELVIPEAAYVLAVTGTGCADTNEKARVALEKIDNVSAAYVNRGITLHLAKAGDLDQEVIAKTIAPYNMAIQAIKPLEGKPF